MEVAFILSLDPLTSGGGIRTYVKHLSTNLSDLGHKVTLISPRSNHEKAEVFDKELNMTRISGREVKYPDDFTMNTPICHQSIFYSKRIIRKFLYNTDYKVLGDCEQMLRIFGARIESVYIDQIIVSFERGGFSFENGYKNVLERWKILRDNFNLFYTLRYTMRMPYNLFAVTVIKLLKNTKLYKYYRIRKFKMYQRRD